MWGLFEISVGFAYHCMGKVNSATHIGIFQFLLYENFVLQNTNIIHFDFIIN